MKHPALIRHVRRALAPGWGEVWQTEDGKAVSLGGAGIDVEGAKAGTTTMWEQELSHAWGKPFKYGLARFGEPHRFEFIVRPPAIPAQARRPSSGVR